MEQLPYGYCGMPCALCTRHRTDGKSRCDGCSAGGYYTDVCRVYRCCREKGLTHCGLCADFPCARLGKMGDFRDLTTNGVKQRACAAIAGSGFAPWYADYAERAALLTHALENYNSGRNQRFLCELCITRDIDSLRDLMRRAEALTGTLAEKARAFRALADAPCPNGDASAVRVAEGEPFERQYNNHP